MRRAVALLGLIFVTASWALPASAQGPKGCVELPEARDTIRIVGEFTPGHFERFYCVEAHGGQRMRVTVVPQIPDLHTQGNVRYPHGDLEPGAPGGVVLDERLTQDGVYRIRVGQRFNERKAGRFELIVELR